MELGINLALTILRMNGFLLDWPWCASHYSFDITYLTRTIRHVRTTIRSNTLDIYNIQNQNTIILDANSKALDAKKEKEACIYIEYFD